MKKYISTIAFLVPFFIYSQVTEQKKEFLNDYAVCECLTQSYYKLEVKLNDISINYWKDANILSVKKDNIFNTFITAYVKKMPLNQSYDGSTSVINYCLSIKNDKEYLKLRFKLLKR